MSEQTRFNFLKTYIYDSPDGKDCLKKTLHTAKFGGYWGAIAAIINSVTMATPASAHVIVGRFAYFTVPGMAMGATFAATSCLTGEMRGKDNVMNHAIGGVATGVMLGIRTRSFNVGLATAAGAALVMSVGKLLVMDGQKIWPKAPFGKEFGTLHHDKPLIGSGSKAKEPTNY